MKSTKLSFHVYSTTMLAMKMIMMMITTTTTYSNNLKTITVFSMSKNLHQMMRTKQMDITAIT
jgi:hypothetical protein